MSLLDGPTFEARFQEVRPGLLRRLWRDIRCAAFIAAFIWRNATVGRRVRKKYRACAAAKKPFWID